MGDSDAHSRLSTLLADVKRLAKEYYHLTGRPLGVTGEIGEYEAARFLNLELAEVRQAGYDAIHHSAAGEKRLEIKTRVVHPSSKNGQRIGSIDMEKPWDAVLLVLLDNNFEAREIIRADREAIEAALLEPGSRARNERRQLSVSKFRQIGARIWPIDGVEG